MSRCRSWIAIVVVLTIATALAAVAVPQKAEAATLKGQLHHAKSALHRAQDRLKAAEADLAAAIAATGSTGAEAPSAIPTTAPAPTPVPQATAVPAGPSVEELKAAVAKAHRAVTHWKQRVRRLSRLYHLQKQMAAWERQGRWMPIIRVAAAKYHVSATGMYRMMMRESGGQRLAGSSTSFKGLFQYYTGTWAASWNPWRHDSIYDGSSQIYATALALHKGMGPQMWTTTYWSQY